MLIAVLPHAAAHPSDTSASSTPATAVDEIKALEQAHNQALLHGNVAALDKNDLGRLHLRCVTRRCLAGSMPFSESRRPFAV